MRVLFVMATLAALPLAATGQEFDPIENQGPRGLWLGRPATRNRQAGTDVLPGAWKTWREDGAREGQKEKYFWDTFRRRERGRLLVIQRAETARALAAARAKAQAYYPLRPSNRAEGVAQGGDAAGTIVPFPQPAGAIARAAGSAAESLTSAGQTLTNAAQPLAKAIEQIIPVAKSSSTRNASVIIALLVIFLAPALLLTLLAFGVVKLRRGHRLFQKTLP